jgi:hypothetical protein
LIALILALALDALIGEPPPHLHPAVWMGRAFDALERRAPSGVRARRSYGTGVALGNVLAWGSLGWIMERFAPWPLRAPSATAPPSGSGCCRAGSRSAIARRSGCRGTCASPAACPTSAGGCSTRWQTPRPLSA